MNIRTDAEWLEAEFINELTVDGKKYEYRDTHAYSNELERKRYFRRYAKLSLYRALSDYSGEKLEWGALTGIRPVKFAYSEGENWRETMKNEMFVSDNKIEMVARIMEMQKGIYEIKEGNADFFVGIPFCPSRCLYCSFVSNEIGKEKQLDGYVEALCKEIEATKKHVKNLRSVYVGGGTPVSLPLDKLEKILTAIGKPETEYTVEAGRPDCITEETLKLLKTHGVTRICVNPQTFNDKTLKIIGRKHTAEDIIEKYGLAKKYGFDVNMDLIAGLPDESFEDFKRSIDAAVSLSPDNITVHTLSLKKGSILKEKVDRLPEGEIDKMINYSAYKLINEGYEPYYMYRQSRSLGNLENVGWCKPGTECFYNVSMMEELQTILSLGAGGVSKRVDRDTGWIERANNPKYPLEYIRAAGRLSEGKKKLLFPKK